MADADTEEWSAILFADVSGSTALYETVGDTRAVSMIGACIDRMAEIAAARGGVVIRSKGDDLLCTFDATEAAIDAATAMLEAQAGDEVSLHAGVHYGNVIRCRGDVFGDAVNVTARLLSLAKPGELVLSEDAAACLPESRRGGMTRMAQQAIRGHSPMDLFSLVVEDGETTQFAFGARRENTDIADVVEPMGQTAIEIVHDGAVHTFTEGNAPIVIGRSPRCDIVLGERCVSREHATMKVEHGRVVLTDRSSGGTFVLGAGPDPIALRRESIHLTGNGEVAFGRHPATGVRAPRLRFRLVVVSAAA